MQSILILLHCESNTGYAIGPLEHTFYKMAMELCEQDNSRIHFAYPSMKKGPSPTLPPDFTQYVIIDTKNKAEYLRAEEYIRKNNIDTIFGFDQPVASGIYKHFRRGGVKHFISYWGAPMSSIFGPIKRALKKIEVTCHTKGPDLYIFESQGMADTAVYGRGIPPRKTAVVYLGVDTHRFHPDSNDSHHVYEQFDIPLGRKIFFFSGHMEERKGIAVIMQAANLLIHTRVQKDWHMLLLGNKSNEAQPFLTALNSSAVNHVTFGGYRDDIERIHRGCFCGIIASTGWDSLTCSSVEMQASGLPVIVSDLPGLREAIEPGVSGLLCKRGNSIDLAEKIIWLLENPKHQTVLSGGARRRATEKLSKEKQIESLVLSVRNVTQSL